MLGADVPEGSMDRIVSWLVDQDVDEQKTRRLEAGLVSPSLSEESESLVHYTTNMFQFNSALFDQLHALEYTVSRAFDRLMSLVSVDTLRLYGFISQVVKVTEDQVLYAFLNCLKLTHTFTSGSDVSSLACLSSSSFKCNKDDTVGILISGGTFDPVKFDVILSRALEEQGQVCRVEIIVPSDTTVLANVLKIFSKFNCTVTKIFLDSTAKELPSHKTCIRASFTCAGPTIQKVLLETLEDCGYTTRITTAKPSLYVGDPLAPAQMQRLTCSSSWTGVSPSPIDSTVQPIDYVSSHKCLDDITVESIQLATQRLLKSQTIFDTPIYRSAAYSRIAGCSVYLMLENIQNTGSFKIRGSSNKLLKSIEAADASGGKIARPRGVVACSAGMECSRMF